MITEPGVESANLSDFARIMNVDSVTNSVNAAEKSNLKINVDEQGLRNGLAQLVLAVIKLVHELLERQAIQRMDGGSLSEDEIERLGLALMAQNDEIQNLMDIFRLTEDDLNIDLGPLGKLLK